MEAIKRSQANQGRQPDSFGYKQEQAKEQLGTSGIKVEIQNLIVAILDDPIVSRVFNGAGFSSFDLKLAMIMTMSEDVQPLLAEVRESGLVRESETLTKSLTHATEDLRRVHSSILTPENTKLIQKSIYTLILTLKNVESISSDILGFTGDEATRCNLKLLIKSLSRLL